MAVSRKRAAASCPCPQFEFLQTILEHDQRNVKDIPSCPIPCHFELASYGRELPATCCITDQVMSRNGILDRRLLMLYGTLFKLYGRPRRAVAVKFICSGYSVAETLHILPARQCHMEPDGVKRHPTLGFGSKNRLGNGVRREHSYA